MRRFRTKLTADDKYNGHDLLWEDLSRSSLVAYPAPTAFHVQWPKIVAGIEINIRSRRPCEQQVANVTRSQSQQTHSWLKTAHPWQRVRVDD